MKRNNAGYERICSQIDILVRKSYFWISARDGASIYYSIQLAGTREELLSVIGIPATWCNLFGKHTDSYVTNLFLSIIGYVCRSSA